MKINILHLIEGARQAYGLTVIIDVFRAFSLACYIADNGAKEIITVGDIDTAYSLKKKHSEYILIGERNNKKMPGFDFGNSPFQVKDFDFSGKTVIHTTSAGTQGISNALNADEIITGSFVNAQAIIHYINEKNPKELSLVCMGYSAKYQTEEDTFCAEFIKNGIEKKESDFDMMKKIIRKTSGSRFFIPEMQEHCPQEDFFMCLDLNRFNFILSVKKTSGLTKLRKIPVS